MDINWNDGDVEYENLYLRAAIDAAEKRQVHVRILLSSLYAYPDDPELDNYDTYIYINDYASRHNITEYLEARLVDYYRLELSKIHNKGMIVDGNRTLISSINWNRNSVTQNREIGVIIESEEVACYFTQIFVWDWNEPPVADANGGISGFVSEPVQFTDLTFDSDGNLSYLWDFGDGVNSTLQNPSHTYKQDGFYDVRLTVTDGQYTDSVTLTVIIDEAVEEEGETTIYLSAVLLLIFLVIIVLIVCTIRRMKRLFI
jgi:PKD repeat protein